MRINIKKVQIIFLTACILTLILNFTLFRENSISKRCNTSDIIIKKPKIVIDPGHGGVDPGAMGDYKDNEDVLNLKIAKKLMSYLEGTGFEVVMTRYNDCGLYTEKSTTIRAKKNEDLRNRVKIINGSQADLCISVHLNSFQQSKYYGAQSFYKSKCENSKVAAKTIQNELRIILDKNNTRAALKKNDIIIMKNTNIPVVLVECGFLSNPSEERLLNTDLYQEKIAWAIFSGILKYFNQQE